MVVGLWMLFLCGHTDLRHIFWCRRLLDASVEDFTLSNDKYKQTQTTITTTTTTEREAMPGGQSLDILSPQEEKVLRMHHGLSEGDDHVLKFGVGASEETRVKLAMIEQFLIESMKAAPMQGSVMIEEEVELADSAAKQSIIARLLDKS